MLSISMHFSNSFFFFPVIIPSLFLLEAVAIEVEYGKFVVKVEPSGTYFIERGRDIKLQCLVKSDEVNYYLVWKFNGKPYTHINESKLLIKNIQTENSGLYTCVVSDKQGSQAQDKVMIHVQHAPKNHHPLSGIFEEGKPVSITCTVHSEPSPDSVLWKRFGDSGVEFVTAGPHLLFMAVKKSDEATYICVSKNTLLVNGSEPIERIAATTFILSVTAASKSKWIRNRFETETMSEFELGSGSGSDFDSYPPSEDGHGDTEKDFFFIPKSSNFSSSIFSSTSNVGGVKNDEEQLTPTAHTIYTKELEESAIASATRIIFACFGISYGSILFILSILYIWWKKTTPNEREAQNVFQI